MMFRRLMRIRWRREMMGLWGTIIAFFNVSSLFRCPELEGCNKLMICSYACHNHGPVSDDGTSLLPTKDFTLGTVHT